MESLDFPFHSTHGTTRRSSRNSRSFLLTSRGELVGSTRVPLANSIGKEGKERDGLQAVATVKPRITGMSGRVPEEVVPLSSLSSSHSFFSYSIFCFSN